MTPESVTAKAARLLTEGRVLVVRVDGELADAAVYGDAGTYHVSHDPAGWRCTCPARGRCSHVAALRLVTTRSAGIPPRAGTPRTATPINGRTMRS